MQSRSFRCSFLYNAHRYPLVPFMRLVVPFLQVLSDTERCSGIFVLQKLLSFSKQLRIVLFCQSNTANSVLIYLPKHRIIPSAYRLYRKNYYATLSISYTSKNSSLKGIIIKTVFFFIVEISFSKVFYLYVTMIKYDNSSQRPKKGYFCDGTIIAIVDGKQIIVIYEKTVEFR